MQKIRDPCQRASDRPDRHRRAWRCRGVVVPVIVAFGGVVALAGKDAANDLPGLWSLGGVDGGLPGRIWPDRVLAGWQMRQLKGWGCAWLAHRGDDPVHQPLLPVGSPDRHLGDPGPDRRGCQAGIRNGWIRPPPGRLGRLLDHRLVVLGRTSSAYAPPPGGFGPPPGRFLRISPPSGGFTPPPATAGATVKPAIATAAPRLIIPDLDRRPQRAIAPRRRATGPSGPSPDYSLPTSSTHAGGPGPAPSRGRTPRRCQTRRPCRRGPPPPPHRRISHGVAARAAPPRRRRPPPLTAISPTFQGRAISIL